MRKNEKLAVKKQLHKEIKILLISLVGVLAVALGIYYFPQEKSENISISKNTPENLTRDFNHKIGPANAKIKIVEFYDPECEACSAFFPYVKEVLTRHKDKIQLTVRYALYHGNSTLAAKASDAAAIQGKFWEYQEHLFTSQHEWSHLKFPAKDYFVKYAKELGLNVEKFVTDMEDLRRMETISIDLSDGSKLGVNGTPTIFINGKKLGKIDPGYFNEAIKEELKK